MRVLLVSHTGALSGAPMVLRDLAKWLVENEGCEVATLFRADGPLVPEFAALGPVAVLRSRLDRAVSTRVPGVSIETARRIRQLKGRRRFDAVYVNTLTNGRLMRTLGVVDAPILTHVHELSYAARTYTTERELAEVLSRTRRFIAAADCVETFLVDELRVDSPIDVVHEFVDHTHIDCVSAGTLRRELDIPDAVPIVGGAGSVDWRKGDDLFLDVAVQVLRRTGAGRERPHFVWIGGPWAFAERLAAESRKAGVGDQCHFLGERTQPVSLYRDFDVFLLPSREDPYPLVMLETALLGIPTIGFEGSGGFDEFASTGAGVSVPYLDVAKMADTVLELLGSRDRRAALGATARERVLETSDVTVGAPRIASILRAMTGAE